MLNEPTGLKLLSLRLVPMAEAWQLQQGDASADSLASDERFALFVDAEYHARDNR